MLHDKQDEINGIFRTILTTVEDYNDDDADNDNNNREDDLCLTFRKLPAIIQ